MVRDVDPHLRDFDDFPRFVLRKWVTKRDLSGEAERPTDAGTENGGPEIVDGSTDCAPRPPVLPCLDAIRAHVDLLVAMRDDASADAERQREVALFRAANAQGCLGTYAVTLLDVAERLKDERDRLQELVDEGSAAYDELAAELRDVQAALEEERSEHRERTTGEPGGR